jgi:hypothetical protein
MVAANLHQLEIDNAPKEWESSTWDEAIQRRREGEDALTKRLRDLGIKPAWEAEYAKAREGQRFFLLRNVRGIPSAATGRTETYYTAGGTERPFCGFDAIYSLMRKRMGNEADAVTMVFSALTLGEIEPISRERAMRLYDRIQLATGVDLRPRHGQEVPR